jgi:rubrerythrin
MADDRFRTVADILAFAIQREIDAAENYGRMAGLAKTPGLRELLLEIKGEEENHRRLLEGLSAADLESVAPSSVPDMGLSDALADVPVEPDMTLQDLLIFAARKEKAAADLYTALGRRPGLEAHRTIFEFLAGQERAHKLKLETEYEKRVLTED